MNSLDDALRDPVMTALRSSVAPVQYDQALYVEAGAADLWDLQAPYGYRCGVAYTVHQSSHLEQFMLGIDGDALPKGQADQLELTTAVQLLTVYAQSAMQRIFTPEPSGAPPVLDDDELDVVRWAKDVRTVQQISDKLSVSSMHAQRTLRRATKKLGVSSVPAAVLRCIEGGLID